MSPRKDPPGASLLQFGIDVLDQARVLVAAHQQPGAPAYASPVGAHLRHVIEHFDALLFPAEPGRVDYDRRPRDRELECQPAVARTRIEALQARLLQWTGPDLDAPVLVRGLGGLAGEFEFSVASSAARELVFVAGHAIHHYALLKPHCQQQGLPIGAQFGHAPATVAHERQALCVSSMPAPLPSSQETPCNA